MAGHTNTFLAKRVANEPSYGHGVFSYSKPTTTWYPPAEYPIGVNCLDLDYSTNMRVTSYFDNVKFNEADQTFDSTIHLDVSKDGVVNAAGCQWFDNFKHDSNFQHGKVTLKSNQLYQYGNRMNPDTREELIQNIAFPSEFGSQPAVIVWLSGFDVTSIENWSFSVNATDITRTGFKIVGEVWGPTTLNSMEATWIAYPSLRPNIDSGRFDAAGDTAGDTLGVYARDQLITGGQPMQENRQNINFLKNFERPPRVYFALSKIHWPSSGTGKLLLKAYITDTTANGMMVHLDSWRASKLSLSGQWIAIEDY